MPRSFRCCDCRDRDDACERCERDWAEHVEILLPTEPHLMALAGRDEDFDAAAVLAAWETSRREALRRAREARRRSPSTEPRT